jgi:hypothetical protein
MSPTFRDKLRFVRNTACCLIAAQGALLGYGEYQGYLDVRFYGTAELAYQARLHRAEAEVARYAFSGGEGEVETAQAEPTVWAALDHPTKKHR